MSFERGMDPAADPERRFHRQHLEQLELPFTASIRPETDEDEADIQKSLRAAVKTAYKSKCT